MLTITDSISKPEHKCMAVLQTRRKAIKVMSVCIDLLASIIDLSVRTYPLPSMGEDEEFHHWHCYTSAFSRKPRQWSQKKLAVSLCRFDTIMDRANNAVDKLRLRSPPSITKFLAYMIDVHQEAEIMLNESLHSSRVKLGGQNNSCRIQDNVDLTELTNNSFDVENCGYCRHRFVLPIGMKITDIMKYNSKIAKIHNNKMKNWTNTPMG